MNNKLIEKLYGIHKGESCIVICNGPSLNEVSRQFLAMNITFGMNKIFMLPFTPNYYVSVNPLVLEQSRSEILDMNCVRFVREDMHFPQDDTLMHLHSMRTPLFSYNPARYVYEGHTVTFVCLQLAFFMGFQKVGIVGMDHKYNFEGSPNEELFLEGKDPNHFSPDYFRGQKWHAPDLQRSEEAYAMAKEAFESDGRQIFNLTLNSALSEDIFPKMSLSQWKQ